MTDRTQPPPPPPPMRDMHGGHGDLAGLGQRLGARLLDILIVFAAVTFAGFLDVWVALAVLLGGVLYEPWMTAVTGQTLGKRALNIAVVRADNGLAPGWGKSLGRWIIPGLAGAVSFGAGWALVYLSTTWGPQRKGWHDLAADTLVVRA